MLFYHSRTLDDLSNILRTVLEIGSHLEVCFLILFLILMDKMAKVFFVHMKENILTKKSLFQQ